MGGDEDLSTLHFKKHYRLDCPMVPDNLDRHRHIIRVTGISNVAVFGGDGVCVFNQPFMGEDLDDFRKVLDRALAGIKGPNLRKRAYVENGTVYAPEVKKKDGAIVHERMPQLAAGPDGEVHLVYVSDQGGSNDVFLRSCVNGRWGKGIAIADTDADEYAPVVASTGKGAAIVAYVGESKGRYEIFTVEVERGKASRPRQLTRSADDAMAPRIACGAKGETWLVWYEWAKMGEFSRDREVFLARLEGSRWSRPVQVSPRDVPTYEDHGEPVVRADGNGGAWVAWAWDYHGTLASKPLVDENSIFVRHVDAKLKLGEILAAGFRGLGRARDYVPSLALAKDGTPWVAWDNSHKSSLGYGAKAVFVNHLEGEDFVKQREAFASEGPLDTPQLLTDPDGALHLLCGRATRSGWELGLRPIGGQEEHPMKTLKLEGKTPRYPTACFDSEGELWVAYTDADSRKWKVLVERVDGFR